MDFWIKPENQGCLPGCLCPSCHGLALHRHTAGTGPGDKREVGWGGRNRWGRGERGWRSKESLFLTGKAPGVSRFSDWDPYWMDTLCFPHSASISNPGISPGIFFLYFLRNNKPGKGPVSWCSKRTAETSDNRITFFPSQAGKRPHRAELPPSNLQAHRRHGSQCERRSWGFYNPSVACCRINFQ